MKWLGLVAAISSFLSIWLGHVLVRRIEFAAPSIRVPALVFLAAGGILESSSLIAPDALSLALGILGITLLWDSFELFRQEQRVRKGHAPANPLNPRHAAFMAKPGSCATTRDMLRREPVAEPRLSG